VTPPRVAAGEPFSVTVTASAPLGLRSVSWRGSAVGDGAVEVSRLQALAGEAYSSMTWQGLVIERPGTYAFEAFVEGLPAAEPAAGYPHGARTAAGETASLTVVERAGDDSR
jgi:hypothetical protein